jgi:hypothetical protein
MSVLHFGTYDFRDRGILVGGLRSRRFPASLRSCCQFTRRRSVRPFPASNKTGATTKSATALVGTALRAVREGADDGQTAASERRPLPSVHCSLKRLELLIEFRNTVGSAARNRLNKRAYMPHYIIRAPMKHGCAHSKRPPRFPASMRASPLNEI